MAIVGTAFVRLRIIGDRLANEIGEKVKESVNQAAPALDQAGKDIGEKVGGKVGDSVRESVGSEMDRVADDIGTALGNAMADNMGRSLRQRMSRKFREGTGSLRGEVNRIGNVLSSTWDKIGTTWGNRTKVNLSKALSGGLVALGGFAITALPSLLAFSGAVVGAVGSTIIPALASIGPAAAGAALAAVGAFSAIKISVGLIGLALKANTPALEDFKKRSEDFRNAIATPIQAGMLSGFNAAMRISRPLVDGLQIQLTTLGAVVGNIAIRFADAMRQGENFSRLERIFATNNVFINQLGFGATALGQAFIILLDNLSPVTDFVGNLVRDTGEWVLQATQAGDASGALGAAVERWFNATRRFVGTLVDFGIGVANVFRAAFGASGGMLTTLEGVGRSFREWTGDPANQERMTRFFEHMRVITGQVLSIFRELAVAAGQALEGTDVQSVVGGLQTLRDLGPPIATMFRSIQDAAGPALGEAFQAFVQMITDLANSGVLGVLSSAFASLFQIISFVLNIPGVGALLTLVAGLASLAKTASMLIAVFRFLVPGFQILRIVISALAAVFGWIPVVIAAVVVALIWFFTQTETGRAIVQAVWNAIVAAFTWAVGAIQTALSAIWTALQIAWTFIQTVATGIWTAISTAFNAVVSAVSTALTAVWNVITTIWNAIWAFIQPILTGIWTFITTVFNGIVAVIQFAVNLIMTIWSYIWPLLALPVRIFYGVVILIFQTMWTVLVAIVTTLWTWLVAAWNAIYAGISAAVHAIWNVVVTVWNAVWGFIQPIVQGIWNFIVRIWNSVYNSVAGTLFAIYAKVMSIWIQVQAFIYGVMEAVRSKISSAWNTISGAVSGAMNAVWSIIQSVWNRVVDFVQGALNRIKGIITNVWGGLESMGSGIVSGLKSAVNAVISGVNTVIGGINWAIDTANMLPGPDIPRIPTIPRLARGGVISPTRDGTLALVAEAGRAERVEPLDPQGLSRRDRAMIDLLAHPGGGRGDTQVTVIIGERELTDIVDTVVEDRESNLADRVLTGTKG